MKCGVGNKAKTEPKNGFNGLKCADLKKQLGNVSRRFQSMRSFIISAKISAIQPQERLRKNKKHRISLSGRTDRK